MDEQQRAEREADDDAFGQVAEDDQHEGDEQHQRVAPRGAQQRREGRASRPCSRRRPPARRPARPAGCSAASGAATQHEQQQEHRMQHAGDRPVRAGADIGGGARDRAGDADAAEQRRADIGDALRHQFAVGAVPPPGHAVGDHGRQQRFDGAEQREGDRVGQHRLHLREVERRAARAAGSERGMPPKRVPMVSTGRRQAQRRDRGGGHRDQHARPVRPQRASARR